MSWLKDLLGITQIEDALGILSTLHECDIEDMKQRIANNDKFTADLSIEIQDNQEQIAEANFLIANHTHGPQDPPSDDGTVPDWAIEKYTNPKITTMEHGIVWAKFIKGDDSITQLRLPYYNNGKDNPPIIEPPNPSSGLRVPLQDGAEFLAYRKPFQADGKVAVELCDPAGYCIEFKWVAWLGNSTTGKEPGDHGL